jgi:hypothetical protein
MYWPPVCIGFVHLFHKKSFKKMKREKAGKQMRRLEPQDILKSSVLWKEMGLVELHVL